ncbi:hypothetical protein BB934_38055 (plasmid) [Microvirga ossetica]|uniref:ABC transporter substrate-binding protein n=1 Tax=Microvirga ossetica TaxID=1882682 RepID=A0A1B2EVS3_9HYPH|nr:extracellular solute-binding protein [Microvirga ossetica]ANY84065.1 hypothetical protein BB934_38055 [Microvirga ossetica]
MIHLRGITWAHTRGFAPLAALGRVWEDFHSDQKVTWETRSLWSFGEEPLERFLDDYDLLVFDYPFAGEALASGWVRPLNELLPADVLRARHEGTVGPLYEAFTVGAAQTALPIDVATHVAASRPDLLDRFGVGLPRNWSETVALARDTGSVAMPMRPTGIWGAFLTLCAHAGSEAFKSDLAFDPDIAHAALKDLQALALHVQPWCYETYPVALLNRLATTDDIAFVPLTYGYCTYGMRGYAPHRLAFHNPRLGPGCPRGAILGGAGIGVSVRSKYPHEAAQHAAWLTSPDIQSTVYVSAGGQPAQRAAWENPVADDLTGGFFSNTLASAEQAYVRPNAAGFHDFQNFAAGLLHRIVVGQGDARAALRDLSEAWREGMRRVPQSRAESTEP